MSNNGSAIEMVLKAREEKSRFQKELLENNNTVVSMSFNIPGFPKEFEDQDLALSIIKALIENILILKGIIFKSESTETDLGPIAYYTFDSTEAKDLKESFIFIEDEYEWGRCVDIDVHNRNGQIRREDKNRPLRPCMVCGGDFNSCVKSEAHTIEDSRNAFIKILEKMKPLYIVEKIANEARVAMLKEVALSPKPGLVTMQSKGNHTDMNYDMFLLSIDAVSSFFLNFLTLAYIDGINENNAMVSLRKIGIQTEMKMFEFTDGVNTQKGLIFIFGTLLTVIGIKLKNGIKGCDISAEISYIAKDIFDDFENADYRSHGLEVYKEFKCAGVRDFVHSGMELAFEGARLILDLMRRGISETIAYKLTLLFIMSKNSDSNILWRGKSLEILKEVQRLSDETYKKAQENSKNIDGSMVELNEFMKSNKLSPGGSADILCTSIVLLGYYRLGVVNV